MNDIELQRYKLMPQIGMTPHPNGKWFRADDVTAAWMKADDDEALDQAGDETWNRALESALTAIESAMPHFGEAVDETTKGLGKAWHLVNGLRVTRPDSPIGESR